MFSKTTKPDPELVAEQRKAQKQLDLLPETLLQRAHNAGIPDPEKQAWMDAEAKAIADYYEGLDAGLSEDDAHALAWPPAGGGGAGNGAAEAQVEAAPAPAIEENIPASDGKIGLVSTLQSNVAYTGKREGKPYAVTLKGHPHGFENRVTQEQLDWLEGEETFKIHCANGFITRTT